MWRVRKPDRPSSRNRLDFIYRLKTGALIEASLMIGAILAGADEVSVARMQEAGAKAGTCLFRFRMIFSMSRDLLKNSASRSAVMRKMRRTTYVTFEGLEQAKKDVERLSGEAIKILDEFEGEHTFLHDLFFYLINRDH